MEQTGNTFDWQALFTTSKGFLFMQKKKQLLHAVPMF